MPFQFRQVSDVGARHPVIARLCIQTSELVNWLDVDKAKREAVLELYMVPVQQRLIRCHKIRDELLAKVKEQGDKMKAANDDPMLQPHVIGLEGLAEGFLYEAKNYLRDLLKFFEVVYGCTLHDASDLADLKGKGQSNLVTWASNTLGANSPIAQLVKSEEAWTASVIRMRNAVEHPGGYSGSLTYQNMRRVPGQPKQYWQPTWQRTGCDESDMLQDMEAILDNLLTFAEDIVAVAIIDKPVFPYVQIAEIPARDRDPACPIRLRMTLTNFPPKPVTPPRN